MMKKIEALITPAVLRWARVTMGLELEEAAKKIGRPSEEVQAWEAGLKRPSIAQARKAAQAYKRPLAAFYLPEPPSDFTTLRDFRSMMARDSRDYSTRLIVMMRTAAEHQQWAREYLIGEGAPRLSFVGTASVGNAPEDLGRNILKMLHLKTEEQCDCRTRDQALRLWISRAEQSGVFVFRKGGINIHECRGFIISDEFAPLIYLNAEDARAAQMFTLAHELAHLFLNISGVSNLSTAGRFPSDEELQVEIFCNKAAAAALLPSREFNAALSRLGAARSVEKRIEALSTTFKVSEEVVARRLLEKGAITQRKYQDLRRYYQQRWQRQKEREKRRMKKYAGGPSFYIKTASNNGVAFTQTVINAYTEGNIFGREASSLLGVKVNHIVKLAETVSIPLTGAER